jgi:hypothetical protein
MMAVVLATGTLAGSPGPAFAGQSPAQRQLSVSIVDSGQRALAGPGVKLRLRALRPVTARVTVRGRTFDKGPRRLAPVRTIRLKPGKARTIRVRLSPGPRRAARGCEARTVLVSATARSRTAHAARDMRRELAGCDLPRVDLSRAGSCDWISQPNQPTSSPCMLPFPTDFYTRADPSSPTGKRLDFPADGMPTNRVGVAIDPAPYGESDGFSQGQAILLKVPGIDTPDDVEANGFVGLDRLGRYAGAGQRAVVIDARTGRRHPIWVGVDETVSDPEEAALMISPARNFEPGRRYIVALRNLRDGSGRQIEAPYGFRYLRDQLPSSQPAVNQRRSRFEGIFRTLRKAGIERSDLYLAWDFTTASNRNNYERVISMRDRAFEELGDTTMADGVLQGSAPGFMVQQVQNVDNTRFKRIVRGTFTVPCFLTLGCEPGSVMELDPQGLPVRNGDYQANFTCMIPQVPLPSEGGSTMWPIIHGHGLLGTAEGVLGGFTADFAKAHRFVGCATDEIGMAEEDILGVLDALTDVSGFRRIPDRLQQGLLNELFLARLAAHPGGFASHPAFQGGDGFDTGPPVIRTGEVYYEGVSQGGIMGGALTAIAPDFERTVLRVGAMNYSTLLTRSSNWKLYGAIFGDNYRDELSRPLVLGLMQILWDRGEPNGYAHLMTSDPPPETPEHTVLKLIALGDHQVTNFASDVQARTMQGMKTNAGAIDPQRWPDYQALWDIPRIADDEYPYEGSAIVYWDAGPYRVNPANPGQNIGTGTPPYGNLWPDDRWEDPHTSPRDPGPQFELMSTFLQPDGFIEDVCGGEPCVSSLWDGDFGSVVVPGP